MRAYTLTLVSARRAKIPKRFLGRIRGRRAAENESFMTALRRRYKRNKEKDTRLISRPLFPLIFAAPEYRKRKRERERVAGRETWPVTFHPSSLSERRAAERAPDTGRIEAGNESETIRWSSSSLRVARRKKAKKQERKKKESGGEERGGGGGVARWCTVATQRDARRRRAP